VSVSECLGHDHRVLDSMLIDIEAFVQERSFDLAMEYLAPFHKRLETHMDAEEVILFPTYERATGCDGPTTVMRREHAEIRRLMRALRASLSGTGMPADPLHLLEEIARVLESHNAKEERVLYPEVDARVAAGQIAPLVARVETFLGES
jgi:iron-sulfur cluster repair protein YtfE (RIC family)